MVGRDWMDNLDSLVMTHRWGKDQEERAAVAQKAQASYSIARQAMEKIAALESVVIALRQDLTESQGECALLAEQVERLEQQFAAATEPVAEEAVEWSGGSWKRPTTIVA